MIETIALSIVPPIGAFAPKGRLESLDCAECMGRITSTMAGIGLVEWAIMGLDLSFTDLSAKGLSDGWQAQAYGIVATTNRRKLRDKLNQAFPRTPMVPRPVRTRKFDGSAHGASYAFKYQYVRRVSYLNKNGRWDTRKVSLKKGEHTELMLALDRLDPSCRIGVVGPQVAVINAGMGSPRIVVRHTNCEGTDM